MANPADVFNQIADQLASQPNIQRGQMFGKLSVSVNGNAFLAFQNDKMAFKLKDAVHAQALAIPNAQLWDPSGKGRPMKEWVQLPSETSEQWEKWANAALEYVSTLPAK
jgi:hypothetical protein